MRVDDDATQEHFEPPSSRDGSLTRGLLDPEIARELYISVHTVNTHVRNIYAKLDARDRSSAVRRARELRLLWTARA
jgi:DNA-binding NarL/FixJ family response regulator